MPLLSVIIPVYNEEKTIQEILARINSVDIDKEIIVIDDGSIDATRKILDELKTEYNNLRIIHHGSNRGKGAAFLTGLSHARAEFAIIQDADLEYNPNDYFKLIDTLKVNKADIVLGARFKKGYHGLFLHRLGNRLLTGLLNFLFNIDLNDCFTCYKLFCRDVISRLGLKEKTFAIEIEIIAKAIKKGLRIAEIPISYHPRTYSEGKKIRCKDGLYALWCIIRYRFS